LGFGLGSVASIVAFGFAAKKSLGLFSIKESRVAAAFSFKWFLPRFLLYGLAILVGAKCAQFNLASTAAGIFLCNAVLILYEPVISRFFSSAKEAPGAFSGEI